MKRDLPIFLASQSPRRRELLAELGIEFCVTVPDEDAEDERKPGESPSEFVRRLAVQKARNVAAKIDVGRIISCDTIVVCRDEILEKPKDRNDARRMLKLLRGNRQAVLSGLCVLTKRSRNDENFVVEVESTELFMEPIPDEEIESYLDSGAWRGKAGAFGYQDRNGWLSIHHGSESNVVGLPLERLKILLRREMPDFPS